MENKRPIMCACHWLSWRYWLDPTLDNANVELMVRSWYIKNHFWRRMGVFSPITHGFLRHLFRFGLNTTTVSARVQSNLYHYAEARLLTQWNRFLFKIIMLLTIFRGKLSLLTHIYIWVITNWKHPKNSKHWCIYVLHTIPVIKYNKKISFSNNTHFNTKVIQNSVTVLLNAYLFSTLYAPLLLQNEIR